MAAAEYTEGILGPPVPSHESKTFLTNFPRVYEYEEDGDTILIRGDGSPPNSVTFKVLTEAEKDQVRTAAGGSLSKVKSANDAKTKKTPSSPHAMLRRGENTKVACLFEVNTKGRVGRIFMIGDGSLVYFRECVRALQEWRFARQDSPTYRIIQFETNFTTGDTAAKPAEPATGAKSK